MPTATLDSLTFQIQKEIDITAPLEAAFAAMLHEIGPGNMKPDGEPMPFKLEPWPGGRWYRDLGNNTGHFWGHVQVIKPPTLLEICGPMFMSYPVASHVAWRLTARDHGCHLTLTHRVLGEMQADHREGVSMGWGHWVERIKARAAK